MFVNKLLKGDGVTVGLRAATTATCGGKAGSLARMMRAGMRVPDGFVVPFDSEPGEAELAESLAVLGDVAVVVRSSASVEDTAHASAAGQHDSFLGVRGAAAVAAKVRACRRSLWSPRAVAYRRAHSLPGEPAMAVVVQRHVDAGVAGVLVTGEHVRVEASWGLGESVVGRARHARLVDRVVGGRRGTVHRGQTRSGRPGGRRAQSAGRCRA